MDKSEIRRFVPSVIVIGRSVFSLKVKQGMPRDVVSSWSPPESVIVPRLTLQQEIQIPYIQVVQEYGLKILAPTRLVSQIFLGCSLFVDALGR